MDFKDYYALLGVEPDADAAATPTLPDAATPTRATLPDADVAATSPVSPVIA